MLYAVLVWLRVARSSVFLLIFLQANWVSWYVVSNVNSICTVYHPCMWTVVVIQME